MCVIDGRYVCCFFSRTFRILERIYNANLGEGNLRRINQGEDEFLTGQLRLPTTHANNGHSAATVHNWRSATPPRIGHNATTARNGCSAATIGAPNMRAPAQRPPSRNTATRKKAALTTAKKLLAITDAVGG